ncbi:hypothetical protein HYY72_01380 [Candidatus Woesearchaeota archaeon]|nr:hypothetical protein [Candidatus Woesearchaeota archaeon]
MARPPKSQIRQNIVEILHFLRAGHGYGIFKIYREIYPKATMRSIYYHLKKGIDTGEFRVERIEKAKGEYSWGGEAEKTIYALGENAQPKADQRVREFLEKTGRLS